MKASEFLKKHEQSTHGKREGHENDEHSLEYQARERAAHLEHGLHVGTPFDWEDLEKYKEELARMEREGPGRSKANDDSDKSE